MKHAQTGRAESVSVRAYQCLLRSVSNHALLVEGANGFANESENMRFNKGIIILVLWLGLFALPVILHAQSSAPDSAVRAAADNAGLPLVAREDLPLTGTFWLITSNGFSLPMPCAPLDQSLPIYAISDNVFLADGTRGMAALNPYRSGYVTVDGVLAAQANAVETLVSQNEASQMRPMMRAMSMDFSIPVDGSSLGNFTNDAMYSDISHMV